jgi:hypothetical protein
MLVRRLDDNHDMTFGQGIANMADEAESVAQRVYTRLLLLFSEWFLDTDAGVPYLRDVTIKPANMPLAEAVIKQTIIETDGVLEIRSFNMTLDRETRRLTISATVSNVYGTTSNIKVTK